MLAISPVLDITPPRVTDFLTGNVHPFMPLTYRARPLTPHPSNLDCSLSLFPLCLICLFVLLFRFHL